MPDPQKHEPSAAEKEFSKANAWASEASKRYAIGNPISFGHFDSPNADYAALKRANDDLIKARQVLIKEIQADYDRIFSNPDLKPLRERDMKAKEEGSAAEEKLKIYSIEVIARALRDPKEPDNKRLLDHLKGDGILRDRGLDTARDAQDKHSQKINNLISGTLGLSETQKEAIKQEYNYQLEHPSKPQKLDKPQGRGQAPVKKGIDITLVPMTEDIQSSHGLPAGLGRAKAL